MAQKKPARPPAAKAQRRGRPPKMVVKIDDTPENVAKALFGKRSTKLKGPDEKSQSG